MYTFVGCTCGLHWLGSSGWVEFLFTFRCVELGWVGSDSCWVRLDQRKWSRHRHILRFLVISVAHSPPRKILRNSAAHRDLLLSK